MSKVVPLRAEQLRVTWSSSGYRGVSEVSPGSGRFRAVVGKGSKRPWRSKIYPSAELAGKAYDRRARKTYGRLACLNFPRSGERGVTPMDADFCLRGHD